MKQIYIMKQKLIVFAASSPVQVAYSSQKKKRGGEREGMTGKKKVLLALLLHWRTQHCLNNTEIKSGPAFHTGSSLSLQHTYAQNMQIQFSSSLRTKYTCPDIQTI